MPFHANAKGQILVDGFSVGEHVTSEANTGFKKRGTALKKKS